MLCLGGGGGRGGEILIKELVWEQKVARRLPNSNGKRHLDLMRLGDFVVGDKLQCCVDRWTWESGEKKSVIGHMLFRKGLDVIKMVVEDSGIWILGEIIISSVAKWCGGGQRLK